MPHTKDLKSPTLASHRMPWGFEDVGMLTRHLLPVAMLPKPRVWK